MRRRSLNHRHISGVFTAKSPHETRGYDQLPWRPGVRTLQR
ncbi:hypothetical protein ACIRU5_27085 [Streptomyces misionensis]|nr:hypothetical protein [Streptomyces misionensis]